MHDSPLYELTALIALAAVFGSVGLLLRQPVALATGSGQVTFTSAIGLLIGIALGMDTVTSLYIAVAPTFSGTIIFVKRLSVRSTS